MIILIKIKSPMSTLSYKVGNTLNAYMIHSTYIFSEDP